MEIGGSNADNWGRTDSAEAELTSNVGGGTSRVSLNASETAKTNASAKDEPLSKEETEEVAEQVIEDITAAIETDEGREELEDAIDGKTEETRTEDEAERIENTSDEIAQDVVVDGVEVTVDTTETIIPAGEDVVVVYEDGAGPTVVIREGLALDAVRAALSEAFSQIIADIATRNGVDTSATGISAFLDRLVVQSVEHFIYDAFWQDLERADKEERRMERTVRDIRAATAAIRPLIG
ncbi:hypothetical protein [Yoonia sp.]|uniref:hypothetical protein n=1 Tax=Yoonia sp. TaxID=2212373 RepID=UPI0025E14646|nr:hypothetical protein [Yoonia sp.]